MFKLKNITKKLKSVSDEVVGTTYYVKVNTDDFKLFESEEAVLSYMRTYLEYNQVFHFEIYKNVVYSL